MRLIVITVAVDGKLKFNFPEPDSMNNENDVSNPPLNFRTPTIFCSILIREELQYSCIQ